MSNDTRGRRRSLENERYARRSLTAANVTDNASRRTWRGELIYDPQTGSGQSPYHVVDEWGIRHREIVPVPEINLDDFVGQAVVVRDDSGLKLTADKLDFPEPEFTNRPAPTREFLGNRRGDPENFNVRPVQWEMQGDEIVVQPPVIEGAPDTNFGGGYPLDGGYMQGPRIGNPAGCAGCGGCPSCGPAANTCVQCVKACGPRSRFWARGEVLLWWPDGMYLPPLVTASSTGTPGDVAGVLGANSTAVVFGNREVLDGSRTGYRLRAGTWFDSDSVYGIQADYYRLSNDSLTYRATGVAGSPILARPFFNVLEATEDAELVSFPGVVEGTVTVKANSEFEAAGLAFRHAVCCQEIPWIAGQRVASSRIDSTWGYRYARLSEGFFVREDLTSLLPDEPGSFLIVDSFGTSNEFHGAEIGIEWELDRPRWALELLGKLAVGSTRQKVFIDGSTRLSGNGFSIVQPGGLLAQRSNGGRHERSVFSMIPEFGANFILRVTPNLSATLGYSLVYWSRVARPGEQVDLDVNIGLIPPEEVPLTGPLRPSFAWHDTDYWAHGLSLGADYRW